MCLFVHKILGFLDLGYLRLFYFDNDRTSDGAENFGWKLFLIRGAMELWDISNVRS